MRGRTVAFFCFAAFFGLDGSVSGGRSPAAAEGPDVPPEVRVGGETVDLAADPDALIERVSRAWLSERVRVEGIELELERSRYWFGARVDRQRLKQWLLDARNPASALRRVHRQVRGDAPLELPLPRSFEAERLFDFLVELKADIDRRPENARVDTDTKQVLAHRDGLTLDVWATVEEFEVKLLAGERTMRLVVETEAPTMTREDVGEVSLDAVLGTFRTRYNPTEKAEDRTFNLRVAAAKIDGMVVLPGREFDFNALVGERNEANGFRVAPVIAAGELVDGIGGGTCQVSGTLHGAVFFAGLPILDRRPHSRPSFYIKLGLDAAVSYPTLNFRFRNDLDFPIVIGLTVEGGWVRSTLWGREHHRQVSFIRRVDEAMAFEERDVEDADLPSGVRVLSQRGIPGFRLKRWRIVRDMRSHQAIRESMEDIYPPTTQIWRVGTGGPIPEEYVPPSDDDHPEYTADEYLSMTQGVGLSRMQEIRRAGRYGVGGWTVAAGFTDLLSGTVAGE